MAAARSADGLALLAARSVLLAADYAWRNTARLGALCSRVRTRGSLIGLIDRIDGVLLRRRAA